MTSSMGSLSRWRRRSPTTGWWTVVVPPSRLRTSWRAHRVRNRWLDSASSPTSSTNRGLSVSSPIVVRRAATKSAVALAQSWWNACSSGSRRRERSRFWPGRRRGRVRRPWGWRPGRRTRALRRTRVSEGGRAARALAPVRARVACGAAPWGVPQSGRADTSVRCRRAAGRARVIRVPGVRGSCHGPVPGAGSSRD